MDSNQAEAFARDWIACWNRSDIEALMEYYADGVVFASPRAEAVTGNATVEGKVALRSYWTAALRRAPSRLFTLDRAIWDHERSELVIVYASEVDEVRLRACEIVRFDTAGRIVAGEALYGARLATG